MRKLLKMFGVVALFGAFLMAGGCGGGDNAPGVTDPSVTSPVAATVNPNGTATTGASITNVTTPAGTTGYLANVSVSLPPNTVITAKNADGTTKVLTAPPTMTFAAPADSTPTFSGVHGVPVPAGFTSLASTSGAVNVAITGAASATFSPAITITLPVPGKAVGSVIRVYSVKDGTTTYTLLGDFPVTTAGLVSFLVSDFCEFVGDPVFRTSTGVSITGTPATSVRAGASYSFIPSATGSNLTFSIVNKPTWATFSASTGQLSGTPTAANVGTTSGIVISVTDGVTTASLTAFSITVPPLPTISGTPASSVQVGASYSFIPSATGSNLAFSIVNKPTWATFNTTTGQLSGTPTAAAVGTTSGIVISVTDGVNTVSLSAFSLTVSVSYIPPTISGTPATSVRVGASYSFTPSATGSNLTFSIINKPTWATFNTATGQLSGTPTAANVGTTSGIVISVTDGITPISLPAFSITVPPIPTISGTPATSVFAGASYSFTPSATGSNLTFSIVNKPAWATFNTATGQLSGTPTAANAGIYSGIVISVTDGVNIPASLPAFSITVASVTGGGGGTL